MSWVFDKSTFLGLYPELASAFSDVQLNFYADMAMQMFDATRYCIKPERYGVFYNSLVAHLLALAQRGANGGVGAVNAASEGSVSVGFQGLNAKSGSWFNQTPYGSMFWRLVSPYISPKMKFGNNRVFW